MSVPSVCKEEPNITKHSTIRNARLKKKLIKKKNKTIEFVLFCMDIDICLY